MGTEKKRGKGRVSAKWKHIFDSYMDMLYPEILEELKTATLEEKIDFFKFISNKVVPNAKPEESPAQSTPLNINVSFDDSK
jgi:hypothetical protein